MSTVTQKALVIINDYDLEGIRDQDGFETLELTIKEIGLDDDVEKEVMSIMEVNQ